MKVLILYEELAGYFLACLTELAKDQKNTILVIMKRINAVAPFNFTKFPANIEIVERESFTEAALKNKIKKFNPDISYLAGWLYKPYFKIIKQLQLKNVALGFDNQYSGSLRQLIGSIYFRWYYKPNIKAAFVPGKKQVKFARLLGFREKQIAEGLYCCDVPLYNTYYANTFAIKQNRFPKRFLFVGRYVNEKGIQELWQAFAELKQETNNEWELWCLGKGSINAIEYPHIKHFGFKQADELEEIIASTGVFILPSRFEPWGVVIHEYATAGFPIITTNAVGASEWLVTENETGFLLPEVSVSQLKTAMRRIIEMNEAQLVAMGNKSHELAQQLTPQIWCKRFITLATNEK
jgi:glycosyltransferase involved in cell wall biosynthesis